MLDYSGMYKTKNAVAQIKKKQLHNETYIRVPERSVFYISVKAGDSLVKGQTWVTSLTIS